MDDDISFAKLLAVNLAPAGRLRTEVFDDPEKLFDRYAEEPPDVVVTGLVMPGLSGIEVTRRLRQIDPHLPIFVLTAHAELDTAIEALKAGANEYLTKPVNIDELMTLLRRALKERPLREDASSLEAGSSPQSLAPKFPEEPLLFKEAKRLAAAAHPLVVRRLAVYFADHESHYH